MSRLYTTRYADTDFAKLVRALSASPLVARIRSFDNRAMASSDNRHDMPAARSPESIAAKPSSGEECIKELEGLFCSIDKRC